MKGHGHAQIEGSLGNNWTGWQFSFTKCSSVILNDVIKPVLLIWSRMRVQWRIAHHQLTIFLATPYTAILLIITRLFSWSKHWMYQNTINHKYCQLVLINIHQSYPIEPGVRGSNEPHVSLPIVTNTVIQMNIWLRGRQGLRSRLHLFHYKYKQSIAHHTNNKVMNITEMLCSRIYPGIISIHCLP